MDMLRALLILFLGWHLWDLTLILFYYSFLGEISFPEPSGWLVQLEGMAQELGVPRS